MHLRLIGAVLVLLGLVAAGTGIASATLWRPADRVQAEALAPGASTLLVTDPGVLELLAGTVTARASGPQGAGVVLAVGREADVLAWVGVDPHARVTGLADAATLVTVPGQPVEPPVDPDDAEDADDDAGPAGADAAEDTAPGDAEGALAPDPAGSDMWVAEVTGESSAELVWESRPGRWSLLVASTGAEAGPPTLELVWPREVVTPWLRPGLWIGGALVVIGAAVLVLARLRGRGEEEWTEIEEPELAVPSGPLTRRQLRELEAARAAGRGRVRRRRAGGGDASDDAAPDGGRSATEPSVVAAPEPQHPVAFAPEGVATPSPVPGPEGPGGPGVVPYVPTAPAVTWPSIAPGQAPRAAEPSAPAPAHSPGPTSADAWRARWGFVEVPPAAEDEAPEGDRP